MKSSHVNQKLAKRVWKQSKISKMRDRKKKAEEGLDKRGLQSVEISKMHDRKKKVRVRLDKKELPLCCGSPLIQRIRKAFMPG